MALRTITAITVWAAALAIGGIRARQSARKTRTPVAIDRTTAAQQIGMAASVAGFVLPLIWASTPWLAFADYAPHPARVVAGAGIVVAALWLFQRTHRDLQSNWSYALQIMDGHELVTTGLFARVRHPMYLSLLMYGAGHALLVPNWMAGPACLVGNLTLVLVRIPAEEAMLAARFGDAYRRYAARTRRMLPWVW